MLLSMSGGVLLSIILVAVKNLSEYIVTGELTLSTLVNPNNLLRYIDTALPLPVGVIIPPYF